MEKKYTGIFHSISFGINLHLDVATHLYVQKKSHTINKIILTTIKDGIHTTKQKKTKKK